MLYMIAKGERNATQSEFPNVKKSHQNLEMNRGWESRRTFQNNNVVNGSLTFLICIICNIIQHACQKI